MPVEALDYSDEEIDEELDMSQTKTRSNVAPSLGDEEAFPDFGGDVGPAAPALNFSAAWSSSAAKTQQFKVVPKVRKAAPKVEQVASSNASFGGSTAPERAPPTGAGVPWSESQWQQAGVKDNTPSWAPQGNRVNLWDQACQSAGGRVRDPYATVVSDAPITIPKRKAAAPAPAPVASEQRPAEPKVRREKPKKNKDDDGFTEVATRKREEKDQKDEPKSNAKVLGAQSMFASLGGDADANDEKEGKKGKNAKKKEKKGEEADNKTDDVVINTAPKKKKEKKKVETDPFAEDTKKSEPKKKGSKKGNKGGSAKTTDETSGGLPVGVIGAALVAVAGIAFYFTQQ